MASALATLAFLTGLAAITAGFWMVFPPAGLIAGGVLVVVCAWLFRSGFDGPSGQADPRR